MKILAALLLVLAGCASANDVTVTVNGRVAPGVYGSITIGDERPRFYQPQPVIIVEQGDWRNTPPLYLYVPLGHRQNWRQNCWRYNACGRQVFFVHDDWVRDRDREWQRQHQPQHHGRGHDRDRDGRRDNDRDGRHDRDDRHQGRDRDHDKH